MYVFESLEDAGVVDAMGSAACAENAACGRRLMAIPELYVRRAPEEDVDRINWAIDGHANVVAEIGGAQHQPGPRSSNSSPSPITRSRSGLDTSTSFGAANALTRAPMCTPIPPMSSPADFAFAGVQLGAHMDAERLHRVALARIAASVLAFVEQFVCSVRSTARRSPRGSTTTPLRVAVARSRWFQSRADHRAIVSA
jgi:hypothetical protein